MRFQAVLFDAPGMSTAVIASDATLPAGRYRIALAGASAVTVRLTWSGPGQTTTVRLRGPAALRLTSLYTASSSTTGAWLTKQTAPARTRELLLLAGDHSQVGSARSRSLCVFSSLPTTCVDPDDIGAVNEASTLAAPSAGFAYERLTGPAIARMTGARADVETTGASWVHLLALTG
jgi:hypothetical protein